ncbi:MAG TPA: ATP-binding cassette domain-containing protein [Saprospiraceae bacterium]|nr:ATP-binding cassette domain-containing protein [Saprospiraceae bacterium]
MSILRLEKVTKRYKDHIAVDEVSFEVQPGTIFGMLGPNGAGKTSTIRIITTITAPDSGQVFFNGELLNRTHPAQMGYLPEERGLYKKMKVGAHLIYLAQLKGLSVQDATIKCKAMLERFEAGDWWNKKVEELSKGMQQKIQFIATIVHDPILLILDEPFTGLDPINSNMIQDEIFRLRDKGVTIIFSTHRMEQVEEMCENIILIHRGKNILQGNVAEIRNKYKEHLFKINYKGTLPQQFSNGLELVKSEDHTATFRIDEQQSPNSLLQYLIQSGCEIYSFQEILPSINEIFINQVKGVSHE